MIEEIVFISFLGALSSGARFFGKPYDRGLPKDFTLSWKEVANTYVCSTDGDASAIMDALQAEFLMAFGSFGGTHSKSLLFVQPLNSEIPSRYFATGF